MVMIKRATTTTDLAGSRRLLSSRLSQLDAAATSAAASSKSSQLKSDLHVPVVRRSDQRSTVSIAGSSSVGSSHSSGSRFALMRGVGDGGSPRFTCAAATNNVTSARRAPKPRQHLQLGKTSRCGAGIGGAGCGRGGRGGVFRRYLCANSAASNSAGVTSLTFGTSRTATDDDAAGRGSRMSSATTQRLGKTVSISASQDCTASTRMGLLGDASTRSIIKLKPLSRASQMCGSNNDEPHAKEAKADTGMTPHQLREQEIFNECRFVPIDPFYKKVLVAPNQDRQFFAAPKSIRAPGSRMLYDIANQNSRHHQDVNFDFTRGSIKKICPNFCQPAQFRHFY